MADGLVNMQLQHCWGAGSRAPPATEGEESTKAGGRKEGTAATVSCQVCLMACGCSFAGCCNHQPTDRADGLKAVLFFLVGMDLPMLSVSPWLTQHLDSLIMWECSSLLTGRLEWTLLAANDYT